MNNSIEIIDIERALKELGESEKGRNKSHASLFTLVLYSRKGERDNYFQKSIDTIISKFPCRLVAVTREKEAKDPYLRTKVSSESIGKALFCEKIHIEVGGTYEERVPSLILPHLLPDLPLFLIWSDVPERSNPLVSLAKRIIIDSEITSDFQKCSKTLLSLHNEVMCEIGDLTWASLRGWRKIIAETFKEEEWRKSLMTTSTLTLSYIREPSLACASSELRALYFQGWLAGALQWQFQKVEKEKESLRINYLSSSGPVDVLLKGCSENNALPTGSLHAIELESKAMGSRFLFKRHLDTRQVFLHYSDEKRCLVPLYMRLGGASEGEEIIEELFYPMPKTSYIKTLKLLSEIPWRTL